MASLKVVHVEEENDGERLDAFLAASIPGCTRSQIQRLIRDGHVSGAGGTLRPSTAVKQGQTYTVDIPAAVPTTVEPQPLPLRIVFEDDDVVVLDKNGYPPRLSTYCGYWSSGEGNALTAIRSDGYVGTAGVPMRRFCEGEYWARERRGVAEGRRREKR